MLDIYGAPGRVWLRSNGLTDRDPERHIYLWYGTAGHDGPGIHEPVV